MQKGKKYEEEEKRTHRVWKSWDSRIRLFNKLSAKIISSKALSLKEAKLLVRLYMSYADKFVYSEKLMLTHAAELNELIRKTYY